MKPFLFTLGMVAALVVAAYSNASAQIPRMISYQGVLTDGAGTFIADGGHTLTLKIYDNIGAPAAIFTESQTVPVIKGIFNAVIGSVTPIPATMAFDRAYYLGVSVDGGAEMAPRTPMSAVPYALHAVVADGLSPTATGVVTSINGLGGAVTLQGGGGTTINQSGSTVTISSTGGGGTGIQGVQSSDGSLTVTNASGPVATLNIANGGVTNAKLAPNAVTSANILDGTVTTADIGSGAATSGQVMTANGSGGTSWMNSAGGLTLPFAGSTSSNSVAFDVATSGTDRAGLFSITNATSAATALTGRTASTHQSSVGVYGEITNGVAAGGANVAAGVKGYVGGSGGNGAGVWGVHNGNGNGVAGTADNTGGTGVYARGDANGLSAQSTSGYAVYASSNGLYTAAGGAVYAVSTNANGTAIVGLTSDAGAGNYGARANSAVSAVTNAGTGVYGGSVSGMALYGKTGSGVAIKAEVATGSTGTALEIANGFIKVSGTNKTAFVHTVAGSSPTSPLVYASPATTDIVLVTPVWTSTYYNQPWGIYWNGSTWSIFSQNNAGGTGTVIPAGMQFNVLVIRQ